METNQPLDQDAINLAKAIRQTESGGNAQAKGASGEYGAYQFMPTTYSTLSKKYGVATPLENSTLEEQNKLAYSQIKEWKDQGYKPDQIASMWNSGKPEWQGNVGVNAKGVKYDTPDYVKKVYNQYQNIKQGIQSTPQTTTSTVQPTTPTETSNPYGATFRASENENLLSGTAKAIGNIPTSAFTLGKGLVSAISHPIQTIKGVSSAVAGGVEKLIPGEQAQESSFDDVINGLKERYGSLDALKKTAIEDPVGLALDVATILEPAGAGIKAMGKAGEIGKVAEVGSQIAKAGEAVNPLRVAGKGIELAGKGLGKLTSETMGVATGTGGKVIRQGLQSTSEGGDAYKAFVEGLKGNADPEQIVNSAKEAVGQVVNNRNTSYKQMLKGLKEDPTIYNPTKVQDTLTKQLSNFGIKETDTGLDFSRSKFALDKTSQGDINNLYELVKGWGSSKGDLSAVGIDNLKQIIGSYYSLNSDYRAFTEALRSSTKDVLKNAPGYTDEMAKYAEATEWINDTKKALSLGDKAMTETAFKKLTGAFRQNNEWRAQAINELDRITGGQLKASIAGQQLSSITPRGLAKFGAGLEGVSAMHSALEGGAGVIPLLSTMIISSPRMVGEFLRVLGLTNQAINVVMNTLNKANPGRIAEVANVANRLNPPNSAFEENK